MLAILIAMVFGGTSATFINHQTSYCECYRDDFSGKYCQSLKGTGEQGSCHK
jgi:hypothetical protein